jgi:hypothetical protein
MDVYCILLILTDILKHCVVLFSSSSNTVLQFPVYLIIYMKIVIMNAVSNVTSQWIIFSLLSKNEKEAYKITSLSVCLPVSH